MAADDHDLTAAQAERVWARVEAHIADDLAGSALEAERSRSRSATWLRAAIIVAVVGLAGVVLGIRARTDPREVARTPTVGALARQAGEATPTETADPRYLAVKVRHPDAVELEQNWIDASGRGCFQAQQLRPVADAGGGPQCGMDMVRIGGLTPRQLERVAAAVDPAAELEAILVADDDLNTPGVRAELVATLLAWDDVDPAVRGAGFRLLDRSGFAVESATPAETVLAGPGAEGRIRIVVDPETTQVRSYAAAEGPSRRTFEPGHRPLPE